MTMSASMLLPVIVTVVIALVFDLINGFHDAANSIATIVSTRVLRPQVAVLWAAFFNLLAMFIFAPKVADTVSKIVRVEPHEYVFIYVVLTGLLGAIIWGIITWYFGLPTSSSHALIGGLSGAGLAYAGPDVLRWDLIILTIEYIFLAPVIGFFLGYILMMSLCWGFRYWRPAVVDRHFRKGQLLSAAAYSLGHGANDAQKTMGVIVAVLLASGHLSPNTELSLFDSSTMWIIVSCNVAMSIGTAFGGWRIVKTMGMKITKLKPVSGFCAESAGALTLFFATYSGIPVSTTHTITGSIIGVGSSTSKFSRIRWGVATRILWAWILTIPASGAVAAVCFYVVKLFFI